jgi:hypothetical protein
MHIQGSPFHVASVKRRGRPGCFRIIWNFYESETAGFARGAPCEHIDVHNFTQPIEDRLQLAFSRPKTYLAGKSILHSILSQEGRNAKSAHQIRNEM